MKKITILAICLLMLGACAGERSAVRKEDGGTVSPDGVLSKIHGTVLPDGEPSAEDLLQEALTLLNNPDRTHDDTEVRTTLTRLLALYPESKWRPSAESLLLFINRQGERMKEVRQLSDGLKAQKTKCEESDSQCRLELTRILQENEQLKKDLQNLKNLEIELEQRNRVMR
jgi:hypothetical protein